MKVPKFRYSSEEVAATADISIVNAFVRQYSECLCYHPLHPGLHVCVCVCVCVGVYFSSVA